MFGQHNDDQNQQQNDFNNFFNQPADNAAADNNPAPAPGAPAGPIGDDHPVAPPVSDQDLSTPEITDHASPDAPADVPSDELLEIKQDALHELTPLVGHLEQTPEEKFRTTMMMIQASDDHSLIKTAYDAAKQIVDEKARAQALLDVVNEINYFTHQQ